MAKRYAEEMKEAAVSQYRHGQSASDLCAQYGIARSTLFLWKKEYSPDKNGQIPREQYLLVKENERLRTDNRIFRESGCTPSSPLSMRIDAIVKLTDSYSLHTLCRVLDVNRSTIYYHLLRAPKKTQIALEDDTLKPMISDIFERSMHRFGARKIRAKLIQNGYAISERRILRLMKELGLSTTPRRPKLNSANDRQYQYYPNKLKRHFLTDVPNKIWVSDITYAKVGMDFLYLCVVIDLFSRKVISFGISEYIDTNLVSCCFRHAFETRGTPTGLVFHSDQGTQYTAVEFRRLLKKSGVAQSFSAPGSPHDNAVAESFFATIKKEDFRQNYYTTESDFKQAVEKYIDYYNDYRPHQRLGFLTPNQAEEEYFQENG